MIWRAFIEALVVFAYFVCAIAIVLVGGYVLGWGRWFGSSSLLDRVGGAANLVVRGGLVFGIAGLLVAFAGYASDQSLVTKVGAIVFAACLPIIRIAEHWGSNGARR